MARRTDNEIWRSSLHKYGLNIFQLIVQDEKWHIDHIFPISAFFEHGITDLKLINHLENLQPLSQKDNNEKSAKYNTNQFKRWLSKVQAD